ncbi:MAG TPA: hypothetical protein DCS38_04620 [Ruminococcus sp.]|nr:hypothetical protein [Ruminococcus sp.]HBN10752.1 hypothetical protein [Ruminococcus sp.]HCR74060.1 hypothetical protein [Ruminococcus sp.]
MKMKKLSAFALSLFTAASILGGYGAYASDMGDLSGDGNSSSEDALMILQHTVGMIDLTDEQKAAADIDGNGSIDSNDALQILQYTVGLKKSLYEKFSGSHTGFFGDDRSPSYSNKNLNVTSFSVDFTEIDGKNVTGIIYMSNSFMKNAAYDFSAVIENSVMTVNVNKLLNDTYKVVIDMNFYFDNNEIKGEILKATIAGESYSFPTVYFD